MVNIENILTFDFLGAIMNLDIIHINITLSSKKENIMKSIKRILSMLLIFGLLATTALLFSSCMANSNLEFKLNSDGESYTCLGFKEGKSAAEAVIPETYKNKPVTAIADNAFNENAIRDMYASFFGGAEEDSEEKVKLTSVTIPNSVKKIGASAFSDCTELKTYNLPDALTAIGSQAFTRSGITGEVKIPDTVTEIGEAAFSATDITSATLPKNIKKVAPSLFAGCSKMISVSMPDTVEIIDTKAFYGCELLTEITFPEAITGIGPQAFGECTGLKEVTIPTTVTDMGSSVFVDTSEELVVSVSYDFEKPVNWEEDWFAGMKGKAINTSDAYYNNVVLAEQKKAETIMKSLSSYESQYKSIEAQIQSVNQAKLNLQASASINPSDAVLNQINNYQKEINQLTRTRAEIASKISEVKEQLKEFKITTQLN